jgi:hypothetical protein
MTPLAMAPEGPMYLLRSPPIICSGIPKILSGHTVHRFGTLILNMAQHLSPAPQYHSVARWAMSDSRDDFATSKVAAAVQTAKATWSCHWNTISGANEKSTHRFQHVNEGDELYAFLKQHTWEDSLGECCHTHNWSAAQVVMFH